VELGVSPFDGVRVFQPWSNSILSGPPYGGILAPLWHASCS